MKLVRFGLPGCESPGVILENAPEVDGRTGILDVRNTAFDIQDYTPLFFERNGVERVRALCNESIRKVIPLNGQRFGPPISSPGKILCVGKNYADHVKEFDSVMPEQPVFFAKATSSLNGPFDPIKLPDCTGIVDSEVELAVVIGKAAYDVSEEDALEHVAGYCVLNDVTSREAQRQDGQWHRAKSCDTFCPLGPWLVTPDEIDDPQKLELRTRQDGQPVQSGTTSDMVFALAYLISYASRTMTLSPGDILSSGTPSGIGSAQTPPILLKAGAVTEAEITGLGCQRNEVI